MVDSYLSPSLAIKSFSLSGQYPLQLTKLIISLPLSCLFFAVFDLQFSLSRSLKAATMKKAVLRLDLHEEKAKKKAMKTVSRLPGVHSISMEMKDQKLTVIGDIDPVCVVANLRKLCHTEIVTVGPAKEPEKKEEEPKKEDPHINYHYHNYPHCRSVEEDPNAICVIS